jgi:hypothetical protein
MILWGAPVPSTCVMTLMELQRPINSPVLNLWDIRVCLLSYQGSSDGQTT